MNQWHLILGITPELAVAEIDTVLTRMQWGTIDKLVSPYILTIDTTLTDPQMLINVLGGTVKITEKIGVGTSDTDIISQIVNYLKDFPRDPVAFSGIPAALPLKALAKQVKTLSGTKSFRFRLLSDIHESSGITTDYKELIIVKNDTDYLVLHTLAVQDVKRWAQKDFGRPKSDSRSGMLPPKVARMMVNCALITPPDPSITLYDPFCGSGTILAEGLDLNLSIIGSDISAKAVADTSLNCHWLKDLVQASGEMRFFVSDALNVTLKLIKNPVDMIVFEGYLGPPHLQPQKIGNYHKGLEKLYIGALKRFFTLLKPGGRLVCALPEYHYRGSVKNYAGLIDSCEKYGYTHIGNTITYGRPLAIIKRSISILQKNA